MQHNDGRPRDSPRAIGLRLVLELTLATGLTAALVILAARLL